MCFVVLVFFYFLNFTQPSYSRNSTQQIRDIYVPAGLIRRVTLIFSRRILLRGLPGDESGVTNGREDKVEVKEKRLKTRTKRDWPMLHAGLFSPCPIRFVRRIRTCFLGKRVLFYECVLSRERGETKKMCRGGEKRL